jgi:hypothetical protein
MTLPARYLGRLYRSFEPGGGAARPAGAAPIPLAFAGPGPAVLAPSAPPMAQPDNPAPDNPAPISLEGLNALERALANDPRATLTAAARWAEKALGRDELQEQIRAARQKLLRPDSFFKSWNTGDLGKLILPADFDFPGRTASIPIDPSNCQFEEQRDWFGWLVNAGGAWVQRKIAEKASFRWADDFASRFDYRMSVPAEGLTMALFSDFGTGLYHSRYIGQQIRQLKPAYAFHLGDVYYAGKKDEFDRYFKAEIHPLLDTTRVFALNSNHEMLSGSFPYFDYVDDRREVLGNTPQEQEGSYFCISSDDFQIIGIDSDYHEESRYREPDLLAWLKNVLTRGKQSNKINILLTANEPYNVANPALTGLFGDLQPLVAASLVDLWFWGNTHNCVLYGRGPGLPFLGSCIGHGGFPYGRLSSAANSATMVRWFESEARFPEATGVRQDRGNNGWLKMVLRPGGGVDLEYVDWMSQSRHKASLVRIPAGAGVPYPYLDFRLT